MRRPIEFADFPDALGVTFGPYRAVAKHVTDGDTFDAFVDFGFNDYSYAVVRLAGINAPEKNRALTRVAGLAAMEYLRTLIPDGTPVRLSTKPDPDVFGRYIAIVERATDEPGVAVVNDEMVSAGHAVYKAY